MPAVSFTLLINNLPAAPDVIDAVQQLEVEDHADMADMLRLTLSIGVGDGCGNYNLLDADLFQPLTPLRVLVQIGAGLPIPLIEAYVIETSASFQNQPGQSTLNVVAMDPTVLMDLEERVEPWPNMADSDIASIIFGSYGFIPDVQPTTWRRLEIDQQVTQRGTDIQLLRQLAGRNGYECYVESDPLTGLATGHFHPPRLTLPPQGVLSVNLGEATNVNSFNVRYDMLRPTTVETAGVDVRSGADQTAQADRPAERELGARSALPGERPRRTLLSRTGLAQTGELQPAAQALVDRSAQAILGEGELNAVAYGGVLRAKRPLLLRGAGAQFSGPYYVERVLHSFSGDSYTQRFSLRRNALGLSGAELFVDDGALP